MRNRAIAGDKRFKRNKKASFAEVLWANDKMRMFQKLAVGDFASRRAQRR